MSSPNLIVHHLQVGQGERIPWLLEELNLPYTLKLYKRDPIFAPASLKAIYPLGASPVFEDLTTPSNPIKIAESGAICEYIAHVHGGSRLTLPPSHKNYAEYLYWFHFSNGTLGSTLFRRGMVRGMVGEADPRYKNIDARVSLALNHVNNRLLENEWLAGDEFTIADVMTGWSFTTMRKWEPVDLTAYEGILAWLKRIGEREAYRRAMGKADPELDVEAGLSAKGPEIFEALKKIAVGKPSQEKL